MNKIYPPPPPFTQGIKQNQKHRHPFLRYMFKTAMQLLLFIAVGGLSLFLFITIAGLSCRTEASVKLFADISTYIWLGIIILFPFSYVIMTGKFMQGVLWGWFLSWSVMFCMSVILPALLIAKRPELKQTIINSFPSAIGVTPFFMFGWFPALIVCGIAYGIHCLIKKRRQLKTADSYSETENPVNPVNPV
jgi:hypothetical protein